MLYIVRSRSTARESGGPQHPVPIRRRTIVSKNTRLDPRQRAEKEAGSDMYRDGVTNREFTTKDPAVRSTDTLLHDRSDGDCALGIYAIIFFEELVSSVLAYFSLLPYVRFIREEWEAC